MYANLSVERDGVFMRHREREYLALTCGTADDENIWLPASDFNALFKIDKKKETLELEGFFNESAKRHSYREIINYKEKLFLIPWSVKDIMIYDKKKHKFKGIEVNYVREASKFGTAIQYRNYIYLFPMSADCIIKFNMETEQYTFLDECYEEVVKEVENPENTIFLCGCKNHNNAWVGFYNESKVLHLNLQTEKWEILNLSYLEQAGFIDIAVYEDKLLLLTVTGKLYILNIVNKKFQMIWKMEKEVGNREFLSYLRFVVYGEKIFLFSQYGDDIIIVNIKQEKIIGKISYYDTIKLINVKDDLMSGLCNYVVNKNILYLLFHRSEEIIKIDLDKNKIVNTIQLFMPKMEKQDSMTDNYYTEQIPVWRKDYANMIGSYALEEFVDILVKKKENEVKNVKNKRSLWEELKQICEEWT